MVGGSLEMGDEEGRGDKLLLLPGEPHCCTMLEGKMDFFMSFLKKKCRVMRVSLFRGLM